MQEINQVDQSQVQEVLPPKKNPSMQEKMFYAYQNAFYQKNYLSDSDKATRKLLATQKKVLTFSIFYAELKSRYPDWKLSLTQACWVEAVYPQREFAELKSKKRQFLYIPENCYAKFSKGRLWLKVTRSKQLRAFNYFDRKIEEIPRMNLKEGEKNQMTLREAKVLMEANSKKCVGQIRSRQMRNVCYVSEAEIEDPMLQFDQIKKALDMYNKIYMNDYKLVKKDEQQKKQNHDKKLVSIVQNIEKKKSSQKLPDSQLLKRKSFVYLDESQVQEEEEKQYVQIKKKQKKVKQFDKVINSEKNQVIQQNEQVIIQEQQNEIDCEIIQVTESKNENVKRNKAVQETLLQIQQNRLSLAQYKRKAQSQTKKLKEKVLTKADIAFAAWDKLMTDIQIAKEVETKKEKKLEIPDLEKCYVPAGWIGSKTNFAYGKKKYEESRETVIKLKGLLNQGGDSVTNPIVLDDEIPIDGVRTGEFDFTAFEAYYQKLYEEQVEVEKSEKAQVNKQLKVEASPEKAVSFCANQLDNKDLQKIMDDLNKDQQ